MSSNLHPIDSKARAEKGHLKDGLPLQRRKTNVAPQLKSKLPNDLVEAVRSSQLQHRNKLIVLAVAERPQTLRELHKLVKDQITLNLMHQNLRGLVEKNHLSCPEAELIKLCADRIYSLGTKYTHDTASERQTPVRIVAPHTQSAPRNYTPMPPSAPAQPCHRPGAFDFLKHPSLIGGKSVHYTGKYTAAN